MRLLAATGGAPRPESLSVELGVCRSFRVHLRAILSLDVWPRPVRPVVRLPERLFQDIALASGGGQQISFQSAVALQTFAAEVKLVRMKNLEDGAGSLARIWGKQGAFWTPRGPASRMFGFRPVECVQVFGQRGQKVHFDVGCRPGDFRSVCYRPPANCPLTVSRVLPPLSAFVGCGLEPHTI